MLIERKLVVEMKSVHPLPPVHFKQLQTHLSLTKLKHGLLVNFKVVKMKEGIHRIFNNFGQEELNFSQ
jgi:GxxExxY protein